MYICDHKKDASRMFQWEVIIIVLVSFFSSSVQCDMFKHTLYQRGLRHKPYSVTVIDINMFLNPTRCVRCMCLISVKKVVGKLLGGDLTLLKREGGR